MSTLLIRNSLARAADGRTVFGTVVPYGQIAQVSDGGPTYRESFAFGAFARSIRERGDKIKLFAVHSAASRFPIGKAVSLSEHPDGLHAAFAIADTRDGDEALTLVRSGIVDSFSVGFRPIRSRQDNGVTVRVEAALMEVSLVGIPAYEGATVAGVRSVSSPVLSVDVARRRLELLLKAW